jgi:hypothetical protein
MGRCGLDIFGLEEAPVAVSCEHGNQPSVSIKGGIFFDLLSDC